MRAVVLMILVSLATVPPGAGTQPAPKPLRVLCWNIHHAEGTDGKLDLSRVARVIKAAQPDLVFLQEVDRNTTRTGKVDQTAELARLTGLHGTFARAIDFQGGEYGLALLTRFPPQRVKTHPLPGKEKQEARIVMAATVPPGDGWPALTVLNTHLQHDDGETRARQAARIADLYGKADGVHLLAGDLNAVPGSPPIQALAKAWSFATEPGGKGLLTIPAARPRQQIDYILFRPAGAFRVVEAKVLVEPVASDHRPVLAVLQSVGR